MTMRLLKPWKRKVAAKIQPSETPHKVLEKKLSDSEETVRLWESDSTLSALSLSFRESISSSLSSDRELKTLVEAATETTPKPKKTVSFDTVEVREYGLIVGDSEDVVDGFPLMLDWCHTESVKMSVDEHEDQAKTLGRGGPIEELDAHQRRLRLRAMGFTEAQLRLAERRRRILTTLDWAYGQNKQNTPPFLNKSFVNNYIK
jgi:hypothetical protein